MQRQNKGNNSNNNGSNPQKDKPDQKKENAPKPVQRPPPSLVQDQKNRAVLGKLLYFSFMMFSLPFLAYYIGTNLDSYIPITLTEQSRTIWGAGAAVVTVNLVIAAYVVVAFREKDD